MLHITETIIVEGKFDKERLKNVTDAPVLCTGGFDLYVNKRTINTIRKLAEKTGIIILTDSDSAGFRIRNYIKQCVGEKGIVKHAYIPSVKGKEHRKEKPGKEGILGVEGMDEKTLSEILKTVTEVKTWEKYGTLITKSMLYEDGLAGKMDSDKKRKALSKELGLPERISANALIDILNKAFGYEEYKKAVEKIKEN